MEKVKNQKWTEKDGVVYFSVTSDGTTGEEWVDRLKREFFCLDSYTESMLCSESFKSTSGITYEIAVLKDELFSDRKRTTKNIQKYAESRKLTTPSAEIGCLIHEKFSAEDLNAMGLYWIVIMHEPIKTFSGDFCIFSVESDDFYYDSCLIPSLDGPENRWHCSNGFAFVVSQTQVSE